MLLIVLWVRSYHYVDGINFRISKVRCAFCNSKFGRFHIGRVSAQNSDKFYLSKKLDTSNDEQQLRSLENALGFSGVISDWGLAFVIVPHWCPVVICGGFALVPWISWRFSLRTLLIATTLVALALGLALYAARK